MKKLLLNLMMIVAIMAAFSISASAQQRISFKRGASSGSVSGRIAGNGSKQFVVGAKRGQTITVSVRSRSKSVYLTMEADDVYQTRRTYRTFAGDNPIEIFNESSRAADYTVIVTIK